MKGSSIEKEDMDVMLQLFDGHEAMSVSACHTHTHYTEKLELKSHTLKRHDKS